MAADIESNQFSASQISEMTASVFSQMFNLTVQLSDSGCNFADSSATVTSCVQISGDWVGAVIFQTPRELAAKITSALFMEEAATLADEDIHDAMGEVGNVLAGNLKASLPGSSTLALPSVTAGTDYSIDVRGCHPITRVAFECESLPFTVTVLHKNP
ncbi:chemotaxis protein CheX [Candidatus Sumerlaeota bacterium]|nr:chemotaxis protein CheX [Candidatus Sumerlaeota bacterium]